MFCSFSHFGLLSGAWGQKLEVWRCHAADSKTAWSVEEKCLHTTGVTLRGVRLLAGGLQLLLIRDRISHKKASSPAQKALLADCWTWSAPAEDCLVAAELSSIADIDRGLNRRARKQWCWQAVSGLAAWRQGQTIPFSQPIPLSGYTDFTNAWKQTIHKHPSN